MGQEYINQRQEQRRASAAQLNGAKNLQRPVIYAKNEQMELTRDNLQGLKPTRDELMMANIHKEIQMERGGRLGQGTLKGRV